MARIPGGENDELWPDNMAPAAPRPDPKAPADGVEERAESFAEHCIARNFCLDVALTAFARRERMLAELALLERLARVHPSQRARTVRRWKEELEGALTESEEKTDD